MNLEEGLKNVALVGAAGKMGRGIALLLLTEIAFLELEKKKDLATGYCRLYLVDSDETGLIQLNLFLHEQLTRVAERQIVRLRSLLKGQAGLISNEEMIHFFVQRALALTFFTTQIASVFSCHLVFEAIVEDFSAKVSLLGQLKSEQLCLTNTSSIPISLLNREADFGGRVAGFHFYNPAPLHPVVEVVTLDKGAPALPELTRDLARRLGLQAVFVPDVAGFIGNNYMMREIAFACALADELSERYSCGQVICMLDEVTRHWLIRPIGVFELIDFVGIAVCRGIFDTLCQHLDLPELKTEAMQTLMEGGKSLYRKKGEEVFCLSEQRYQLREKSWLEPLGVVPASHKSWKAWKKTPGDQERYLAELKAQDSLGAELALRFYTQEQKIIHALVDEGVAYHAEDVKAILKKGFFHVLGVA